MAQILAVVRSLTLRQKLGEGEEEAEVEEREEAEEEEREEAEEQDEEQEEKKEPEQEVSERKMVTERESGPRERDSSRGQVYIV